MAYYSKTKVAVRAQRGRSLGVQLAKLALERGISVQDIARTTGAARGTVYNWFAGRGVTNAYREAVLRLIQQLKNT